MKKSFLIIFAVFSLFVFSSKAYAYTYSGYFKDIRIGLENMASSRIDVSLNGSYRVEGSVLQSGTSITLTISGGRIYMNGKQYNYITFEPESDDNTLKLRVVYSLWGRNYIKEYSYKGSMVFRDNGGKILPVNIISIEEYLKGVVPFEMSNSYPLEALKAQAVAARNYALSNLGKHEKDGYDLDDTTHCQVYRGYNPYYKNAIKAVEDTRGRVLLYNNKPISAYFSASNGGYTEACENVWLQRIPYLKAKPDIYDNDDNYNWKAVYSPAEIDKKLKDRRYLSKSSTFERIDLQSIRTYESGRISNIDIIYRTSSGKTGRMSFSKERARIFLGFNSSMYKVSYSGGKYIFDGKGSGHGLGLSQIGARERARAGQTYDRILAFYYDGTVLESIKPVIKSFSIERDKVIAGEEVKFTAEKSEGSSALFKFVVKRGETTVYSGDYREASSLSYTPKESGYYKVFLYGKDKNSKEEYDDVKSSGFTVFAPPEITKLSFSPEKTDIKKPITVNAEIRGGSTAGVDYRFDVIKDGKKMISKAMQSPVFQFTPEGYGKYHIVVYVKDRISLKDSNDSEEISINVEKGAEVPKGGAALSISRNLSYGMVGSDVKALQEALKKLGVFKFGSTTNYFGVITRAAVITFQGTHGLTPNGVVDGKTVEKINSELLKLQTPTSGGSFSTGRTLQMGMKGDDVNELQKALKKLGYFNYFITTKYFGSVTKSAVISFQKAYGLTANGVVDSKTAESIDMALEGKLKPAFNISRILKKGVKGEEVRELQSILKRMGYFKYPFITNYYGVITENAVIAFQKDNGLVPDGMVGNLTVKKINELGASLLRIEN
ncbi:SpoIID/LytB domain-containing protein [Fonticella tunisiensis]|uniref:SpoIID/LytB domain protein n=1 Tax=Fonticella tunisiensis TaxID=1096341 RepID=A0A4R7KBT7_9CLOT|nr:SpoIID/LytB domain-containing protein [Fonticella tunisiensis]TDT52008.1 SpoIID/LytB domain protein [Fonticella tunisiensis]